MPIYLAVQTLKAINSQLESDQGAAYRQNLQKVLPHMSDAYRGAENNSFRMHLGASGVGKDCSRAIWYSFRWFTKPHFDGRILRLFNRGHMEEARVIALLLSIGAKVYQQDANGKQFRISDAGGHFGGSGDGVAIGLPDLEPDTPCLLEFKTHNDKSWKKMEENGVKLAKPEHYVQMQTYMRKMSLGVALYVAVNKNDDHLYMEIVPLDIITADMFIKRGVDLVFAATPPKKINDSPGWFGCKFCDHKPVCHLMAIPAKNCRTCYFAAPQQDGTWRCNNASVDIEILTEEMQLVGCQQYEKLC